MVGSMDTMQLSAVKSEMVVFLKSMFERGLLDLEMLAEIRRCCIWCIGNFSPAVCLPWPGTVLDLLYLGSERVKAQDGGSLDVSPVSITRQVSRKMLSVIILTSEQIFLAANSCILMTHQLIVSIKKLCFVKL